MLERIYQFIWDYNPCDESEPRSFWRRDCNPR